MQDIQQTHLFPDVKISNKMVQSAALSVINSHRSGQLGTNSSLAELHNQMPAAALEPLETDVPEVIPHATVNNSHSSSAVLSCTTAASKEPV